MKTQWTRKRLEAVIYAVTSLLACEEYDGTENPNHKANDLENGLKRLKQELACIDKPCAW
jgi:hypothetical protein